MITFSGVPLNQTDPEAVEWIENNIPLSEVYEFPERGLFPFPSGKIQPRTDPAVQKLHKIRLSTLRWPRGACNWATFHTLAHESTVAELRRVAYSSSGPSPGYLQMKGGDSLVACQLYLLPPRPLSYQNPAGLWICTMVDRRYFWWYKSVFNTSPASWTDALNSIETALGTPIHVNGAALVSGSEPNLSFGSNYVELPIYFDAVASAQGYAVVLKMDGSVYLDNPQEAAASTRQQLAQLNPVLAGGQFQFE